MTNAITQVRIDLAEDLTTAGFKASDHIPKRIVPPVAIISARSPYLEAGRTYVEWSVNLVVTLIAATAENSIATNALDQLIEDALNVLDVSEVGQPYMLTANNATYLAVDLNTTIQTTIGGN